MKKLLMLILMLVFIIVILPAIIVLLFGERENVTRFAPAVSPSAAITVLKADSGAVETVDLEEYLTGVVAGEMPASFHIEALKAQAVAARTYILHQRENNSGAHPDADVCTDSTHCKAWLSEDEIKERFGEGWMRDYGAKVSEAVSSTRGQVMLYDNAPITAVFHAAGSGRTENSADVWGGDLPYLKSVESPGDVYAPDFYSDADVPKARLAALLSDYKGMEISPEIGGTERSEGGAVKSIVIGGVGFKGTEVRSLLSLPSANFTVEDAGESFIFHVKGKGHGVGLSQYGADYFARNGKAYDEILKIYYRGVEITALYD